MPDLSPMTEVASSYVSHIGHDGRALYVWRKDGRMSRYHGAV